MTKTFEILLKHLGGPAVGLYVIKTPLDEIAREIDEAQPLPEITDEEIFQRRKKIMSHHSHSGDYMSGWYDGAKWYRKQLKK